MKSISKIFGGGKPKVDKSAIIAQEKLIKAQEQTALNEEAERKKALAANAPRARGARESLLSGLETGVTPVDSSKRTQLG